MSISSDNDFVKFLMIFVGERIFWLDKKKKPTQEELVFLI